MRQAFTESEFATSLVEQLASAIGAATEGAVSSARAGVGRGDGWTLTLTATGARRGSFMAWIDRPGATSIAQLILGDHDVPGDDAIAVALGEVWQQATSALCRTAPFAGLRLAVTTALAPGDPGNAGLGFAVTLAARGQAHVAVSGTFETEAVVTEGNSNFDLVLDIELPLVVRFGRTVLSLKALSELGPGSIVDMGRSPDDPVELLVSDRVIARGEVVIVGGNYGVRVTDLVSSTDKARAVVEAK